MKINYFDLGLHMGKEMAAVCKYFDAMASKNINYHNWNAYGFEACELFYDFCYERFMPISRAKIIHGAISDTLEDVKLYYADNCVGHSIFESKNCKLTELTTRMPMMFDYLDTAIKKERATNISVEASTGTSLKTWVSWVNKWAKSQGMKAYSAEQHVLHEACEINEDNIMGTWPQLSIRKDSDKPRPQYEVSKGVVFSKWLEENVTDFKNSFNILRVNIEGAEVHLFQDLIENDLVKHFDIFCGTGHDIEKISEHSTEEYYKMLKDNDINLYRFSNWKPERNDPIEDIIKEKLKTYEDKNVLP